MKMDQININDVIKVLGDFKIKTVDEITAELGKEKFYSSVVNRTLYAALAARVDGINFHKPEGNTKKPGWSYSGETQRPTTETVILVDFLPNNHKEFKQNVNDVNNAKVSCIHAMDTPIKNINYFAMFCIGRKITDSTKTIILFGADEEFARNATEVLQSYDVVAVNTYEELNTILPTVI